MQIRQERFYLENMLPAENGRDDDIAIKKIKRRPGDGIKRQQNLTANAEQEQENNI